MVHKKVRKEKILLELKQETEWPIFRINLKLHAGRGDIEPSRQKREKGAREVA